MFSNISICFAVVVINFNQSMYTVTEDNGPAQIVLTLSNPSMFDITIRIIDFNDSLSGIVM